MKPVILEDSPAAQELLIVAVRAIRQAQEKGAQGKGPSAAHKPSTEVTVHA